MGILRIFISFPGLWDILVWSCTCFYTTRPRKKNKLWTDATGSTRRFRGSIIAHQKGLSVSSNGYFTEFHSVSWFARYVHFTTSLSKSAARALQLQSAFSHYSGNFRSRSTYGWKDLFKISTGYFTDSHLAFWFERYHQLNLSIFLTQGGRAYRHLPWTFYQCSGNFRRSSTHGWKDLFKISNGFLTEFNFIADRKSYA